MPIFSFLVVGGIVGFFLDFLDLMCGFRIL